jgi:hypothetical protein
MAQKMCERFWIKFVLNDLEIKYESPIKLFYDNKLATSIAHNLVHHDRKKILR